MSVTFSHETASHEVLRRGGVDWYPWALAAVVLVSRVLTRSQVYFVDGPKHIKAIQNHTYLIQPPGYWLFNRLAGLFSDPVLAISVFNISCSVLGVVVFYYCARILIAQRALAMWGAAIYAGVFYAWFSAEIHCTYASQLLFPVLMLCGFLQYERTGQAWHLYLAAAAFAIGAGMRPSDGAFLLPFVCWRLIRLRPRRRAVITCAVIVVLCLAWLVPTALAYQRLHWSSLSTQYKGTVGTYFARQTAQESFVANGFNFQTMANVTRLVVGLSFAFWPFLLPLVFRRDRRLDSRAVELALWILPGLIFFLAGYFGHAPHLNFATAPIILLALLLLENCTKRIAITTAVLCLVWNIGFFLFFRPVITRSLPVNVVNVYAGRCTWFSLRHRADADLREVLENPSVLLGSNP
jgi:hypothetical protein